MTTRLTACLLAGLLLPPHVTDRPVLTVAVRNATATVADANDSEFLFLDVQFDAVLRHADFVDRHIGPEPVFLTRVDRFRGPEGWEVMSRSSWYDTGDVKYGACTPGPARVGETFVLPNVKANAVLKRNDRDAHSHLVLRFHLEAACKEGDKMFVERLVTEPVDLKVPKW